MSASSTVRYDFSQRSFLLHGVTNLQITYYRIHSSSLQPNQALINSFVRVQMCFEWFTKGQHDLESDVQQQLFKEKILKLEPYEITMNGECTDNQIV